MDIKRNNLPLNALRAFEAAARHLHLGRAADELCVTYSAVSRQIRQLEDHFRVALFDRSQKPMQLTGQGQELFQVVTAAFNEIEEGASNLIGNRHTGTLRISCAQAMAYQWLIDALGVIYEKYPQLKIQVQPDNELARKNSDIDINVCWGTHSDYPGKKMAASVSLRMTPVASPEYLARSRPIEQPADILDHRLIHEDNGEGWRHWFNAAGVDVVKESGGVYLWAYQSAVKAAVAGHGIVLADPMVTEKDLQTGRLVELLDVDVSWPALDFILVPAQRQLTPPGKDFLELAKEAFRRWAGESV